MRAALLSSVALLFAAPAFAQPSQPNYGPGPCPFNASSCDATATGGTAPRTLSAKAGEILSIKDLGAVCDGSTDDSAAFTAAMAKPTGTTILIPQGATCIISAQLYHATSGRTVNLVGAGRASSVIKLAAGSTLSSDLFNWIGAPSDLVVRDLTIDLNSPTVTGGVRSILGILQAIRPVVRNVAIINGGSDSYLIACNACSDVDFSNNYLALTAADSTAQNKGIATLRSLGEVVGGKIVNNTLVNTNMLLTGSRLYVAGNDVSGWGVGAGVALAADVGTFNNQVIGNRFHDSLTTVDVFGVTPNGIENWSARALIANNETWNNAGSGISNGGPNSHIVGNVSWDNSTHGPGGVGIASAYQDATYNAAGSTYASNRAFDTASRQQYGYGESSASITNVTFNANTFSGTLGSYLLRGSGWVFGPPQFSNFHWLTPTLTAAPTVTAGGATYVNSDTITLNAGCTGTFTEFLNGAPVTITLSNPVLTVTNASGGVIQPGGVSVTTPGVCQAVPKAPIAQLSTSGSGTGATFTPGTTAWGGSWTVPPGASLVEVEQNGGGGAGGSVASGGGNAAAAGGVPGVGIVATETLTPNATLSYTIGAPGVPGATGNNPGGNGGGTTFNGVTAGGGNGGNGSATGNGAAFTLNTINAAAPSIAPTYLLSVKNVLMNVNIAGSTSTGGSGVYSLWSGRAIPVSNQAGTDATGYGGSGSGAGTTGTTAFAGGYGASGAALVRW